MGMGEEETDHARGTGSTVAVESTECGRVAGAEARGSEGAVAVVVAGFSAAGADFSW